MLACQYQVEPLLDFTRAIGQRPGDHRELPRHPRFVAGVVFQNLLSLPAENGHEEILVEGLHNRCDQSALIALSLRNWSRPRKACLASRSRRVRRTSPMSREAVWSRGAAAIPSWPVSPPSHPATTSPKEYCTREARFPVFGRRLPTRGARRCGHAVEFEQSGDLIRRQSRQEEVDAGLYARVLGVGSEQVEELSELGRTLGDRLQKAAGSFDLATRRHNTLRKKLVAAGDLRHV